MMRLIQLLGLSLLLAWSSARADESPTDKARKLVAEAKTNYNLSQFQRAAEQFEGAYRLHQDPALLFNLGQCHRQLQQYDAAARTYRAFLQESKDVSPSVRKEIRALISEMDKAAAAELAKKPPTGTEPNSSETQSTPTATTNTEEHHEPIISSVETRPAGAVAKGPWAYENRVGLSVGLSGLVLTAVGAGFLGAGISERNASLAATSQPVFNEAHGYSVTYQLAGWTIAGVGMAAVVTGAVILTVKGVRR